MRIQHRAAMAMLSAAIFFLLAGCGDDPLSVGESVQKAASPSAPTAAAASNGAVVTPFVGLYFPAGMAGTGSACPYTWQDPAFCVIDFGTWTELPGGRLRIRDMTAYELAFSWRGDGQVEPRKTGYDIVTVGADLDASLSGPMWGTWQLYSFEDQLMFTGTFTGSFVNGFPAVQFVGRGVGTYDGQQMRGRIERTLDQAGHNMYGTILEPGRS